MSAPLRVYFLEDVCRELRCSRRTIERLRRHRAFPIPELPAIDKRPRWSAAAIDAFLESRQPLLTHGRQSPAARGPRPRRIA